MRYSASIILKVRQLRSEGNTYSEIFKKLNIRVPKSTISHWCKDVVLPSWYQSKINELNNLNIKKGQKIAIVANAIKRQKILSRIKSKNRTIFSKKIDKKFLKLSLAFLYLGEGSKWHSHSGLMLGSSNVDIILLYIKLLHVCYELVPKELHCRISYRADQNITELEKYWSKVTGIPKNNFYKTIPDPRTVSKPTKNKDYKGVCVVMTGHTEIQLELETIPKIILKGL